MQNDPLFLKNKLRHFNNTLNIKLFNSIHKDNGYITGVVRVSVPALLTEGSFFVKITTVQKK